MEIERKFLVAYLPNLDNIKSKEIEQVYISYQPEIRVRRLGDEYYLTRKSQGDIIRMEEEKRITKEQYEEYIKASNGRKIEKTRYYIPQGAYTAELDIYKGENKGLLIVEVEFPTYEEARDFVPPSWFGKDVSKNLEYRNKNLSKNPRNS